MVQQSVDLRTNNATPSVPDSEKLNPGVRIRVNRDDDNNNGTPDKDEDAVTGENDLIKVVFSCPALATMTGVKISIKRNNSKLRVWETKEKGTAILKNENEKELTLDANGAKTVWVEAIDRGNGELEWQFKLGGTVTGSAGKVKFVTYKSLIVSFSEETFGGDGALNSGMRDVSRQLYLEGYNIAYYDVHNVHPTSGAPAFGELNLQISQCYISEVALFGHSHGGGAVHDIASLVAGVTTSHRLYFSGYVDAVEHSGTGTGNPFAEKRRPADAFYHWDYYQPLPTPFHSGITTLHW